MPVASGVGRMTCTGCGDGCCQPEAPEKVELPAALAYEALSLLVSADAFIADKIGTKNAARTKCVDDLQEALGVKVRIKRTKP